MRNTLILVLLLLFILIWKSEEEESNGVQTNEIKLNTEFGTYIGAINNHSAVFRGIRYAHAPIGERRFKVAERYEYPRGGVINATQFGSKCVQLTSQPSDESSEDCLFLNIWTPLSGLRSRKRMPVVVFIHGGTFLVGSGSDPIIDGKQYNANGVILVTINYRLGLLGFLSYPYLNEKDNGANGNLGILDQREALFWVNRHIGAFRGDSNNVVIYGESAGAASVLYHLISKNSNGKGQKLFHKAIIQSTIDESLISSSCLNLSYASELYVKKIQCHFDHSLQQSIECIMNKPVEEIVSMVGSVYDMRRLFWHAEHDICPCFDDRVFPSTALHQIETGRFDFDIPIIIGTTLDEGTMFSLISFPFMGIDYSFFDDMITSIFKKEDDIRRIKEYYSPSKFNDATDAISELLGDFYFQCFARKVSVEIAKKSKGRVYRYVFAKRSESGSQDLGVFHSSELPYSFHTTPGDYLYPEYFTPQEEAISLQIIRSYSNFAKSGNPNHPEPLSVYWPLFDNLNASILLINDSFSVIHDFKRDICSFWDENYTGKLVKETLNVMEKEPIIPAIVNRHGFVVLRNLRKILFTSITLFLLLVLVIVKKLY